MFGISNRLHLSQFLPDDLYISTQFFLRLGYKPDLMHPRTFSEKLQWLKLNNRKPEYTMMVDKYAVKKYVADKIGEEYIIPTLGVWDSFDEIDFDALPDQFVLKCTHDSGGLVICKDKSKLDKKAARRKIEKSLRTDYYKLGREWPYKDVPRRIIAEKYMVDESGTELKDYKIFNFGGEPEIIQVDYGRFTKHCRNFYGKDWKYIEMVLLYSSDPSQRIARPEHLDEMLALARTLSKNIPFLRTDFYSINGKVYFGELTFFPEGGIGIFKPEGWDERLGRMVKLPDNKE